MRISKLKTDNDDKMITSVINKTAEKTKILHCPEIKIKILSDHGSYRVLMIIGRQT